MKALLATIAALAPTLAAACPACARDRTPWAPFLIGGLVVAPYLVAAAVLRVIRSLEDEP